MEKKIKSIVISRPKEIGLKKFNRPLITNYTILLDIEICGICGSDLDIYEGLFEAASYPVIPGHEFVGIVDEAGDKIDENMVIFNLSDDLKGDLVKGDRVAVNPTIHCGKCFFCRMYPHHHELCTNPFVYGGSTCKEYPHIFGAWSESIYLLPRTVIFKLPSKLDPKIGVLAEPLANGLRAIERVKGPGDSTKGDGFGLTDKIVIQGAGPLGHMVLIAAKLSGAGTIIVIDKEDYRLRMANKFGADYIIDMNELDDVHKRIERVKELTAGVGADVVVECAGVPSAIPEGIKMVRRGGKYLEMGVVMKDAKVEINPYDICRRDMTVLGQYSYSNSAFVKAIEILKTRKLPYEELVTEFSIDEWKKAWYAFKTKKSIKVALTT